MLYTKVENDIAVEYPLSYEEVCELVVDPHGRPRLPIDADYLATHGYYAVIPQDCPPTAPTSVVTMGMPIFVDGMWYENYLIREMTDEEKSTNREAKSFEVRQARDTVLRISVDSMNPIRWEEFDNEQKMLWKQYRQALLDVPEQEGFPWDVVWPTPPA